ncbi:MAG: hypothetical protein K9M75_03085 [Phycisphaerae bacterium]|nr:hypothetical protein [Phycisphaerae bacterium]
MINSKTKNYITFILALWLLGIAGFCWVAIDQKIEKTRISRHEIMLKEKLSKLDKMIAGEDDMSGLSETVADEKWQTELENFQKRNTIRPLVKSTSTGSVALGILIIISWGILKVIKMKTVGNINQETQMLSNQPEQVLEIAQAGKKLKIKKAVNGIGKIKQQPVTDILSNRSAYDFENINTMYCDADTANFGRRKGDLLDSGLKEKAFDKLEENIRNTIISGYSEHVSKVDQSLKAQSESLEKQVMELRQMAESVREAATGKPAGDTVLSDLTQQISAIREYASQQQNRNEKLQEGYDWNIIKNFCVRIIRCIDNIENRIDRLKENDIETAELEDIRDELIFSLESSGVEQFTPEINSDYSGQEKYAEVIKEKVASDGKNVRGKIAEVIKPGYQYMIDEDNIRVVRAARVKLFE